LTEIDSFLNLFKIIHHLESFVENKPSLSTFPCELMRNQFNFFVAVISDFFSYPPGGCVEKKSHSEESERPNDCLPYKNS